MKRYFITGTDTDCGKTYVTAQLINYFANSVAIKPVASGCMMIENQLVSSDAQQLKQHKTLSLEEINPWRFQLPVSPHIAAKEDGVYLSGNEIANYCMNFQASEVDTLFIEGAGGLMVPLNDEETWLDFLIQTEIPVILVVGMKLGCINHALLTETALQINKIQCTGWVANCLHPEMLALSENIHTLRRRLKAPLLATIPYLGEITSWTLDRTA
jgi:dethiobiotin synthetase